MRYLSFLILSIAIAACCAPRTLAGEPRWIAHPAPHIANVDIQPVYVDKDFSPAEKAVIKSTFESWNTSLNGYRVFVIENDKFEFDIETITRIQHTNEGIIVAAIDEKTAASYGDVEEATLAWWDPPEIFILVERIGHRDLKTIGMHEVGHAMGLRHSSVAGSLMFPFYEKQGGACVDEVTARMVTEATRGLFDFKHMNYCTLPEE